MISIVILLLPFSTDLVSAHDPQYIYKNGVGIIDAPYGREEGKVTITGETNRNKIKIRMVINNKEKWYDVNLVNGKFLEEIWLTEGPGSYRFDLLVHEYERKYSLGPQIHIDSIYEINPFLVPGKHIESSNSEIIDLANIITKDMKSDFEKALGIYEWTEKEITFDYMKYRKHQSGDYDNSYGAIQTMKTRSGVCYDFAAIVTALGRAVGLETKLVTGLVRGDNFSGLHAWNEIYIREENRWLILDATFGSTTNEKHFDIKNTHHSYTKQDEY